MKELVYQLRYALPVWLCQLLTGWMPDNRISIRIRGLMVSLFIPGCGKRLTLGRDVTILAINKLRLGDDVYLAKGTWINAAGGVSIGSEVMFGPYVVVASTNHGFKDNSVKRGGVWPAPVAIGKGSWIGAHAVITAGSHIGDGVLVAANAVVSGTLESNVIAGGVPARVLKARVDNPSEVKSKQDIQDHG